MCSTQPINFLEDIKVKLVTEKLPFYDTAGLVSMCQDAEGVPQSI